MRLHAWHTVSLHPYLRLPLLPKYAKLAAQAQDWFGAGVQHPRVYFSPRRSPAPDTEGAAAAETAGAGCGAVGGVGAAWLWRGEVRHHRSPNQPGSPS